MDMLHLVLSSWCLVLIVYATDPVGHSICLNSEQRDTREWMRGKFVKALNVDMSCVRSLLEVL